MIERTMKAVRIHARGGPDNLVYEECDIPEITEGEVLIRVLAAGITPTELGWNSTYTTADGKERLPTIPGFDVAGIIEDKSSGIGHLNIGDSVYGLLDFWRNGSDAEYTVSKASGIALKPKSIDFSSAASIPLSGLTAWQALFEHANLSPGDRILIHGAGGGVGSLAVQLAHWRGAHVIGTCSAGKADLVRKLGADEIFDYKKTKFESLVKGMDAVLDTIGGDTLARSWQVIRKGGTLVTIADDISAAKAVEMDVKGVSMLVHPDRSQLEKIASMIDDGIIHPVVTQIFPIEEAMHAYNSGLSGHNTGKIVLKVESIKSP